MMRRVIAWIRTHYRTLLFALAVFAFAQWGINRLHHFNIQAVPAFRWMNIFNNEDVDTWPEIGTYLWELRTGIPPLISLGEILSRKWGGDWTFMTKSVYRYAIVLMLVLPVFFIRRRWWLVLLWGGGAVVFLESIILIHPGNPQLYDVILPPLILLYLLLTRASARPGRWQMTFAVLAGLFLSLAELTRPFMILIVALLLVYQFFYYRTSAKRDGPVAAASGPQGLQRPSPTALFLAFLVPLLLLSGSWHGKLLLQHGQLIWSNHGGSNLVNAWGPIVDHNALNPLLQPEEPPIHVNDWTWENINTEVHALNSKLRGQAVAKAIKGDPRTAWLFLQEKAALFLEPQVGMYKYQPEAPVLDQYKLLTNALFAILAFLIVRWLRIVMVRPRYVLELESTIVVITTFIIVMPIIGERGEEARFLISVLPLLLLCGGLGLEWLYQQWMEPGKTEEAGESLLR